MTQQELADQLGVTNKAVSKRDHGKSFPDITLFKEMVIYHGVYSHSNGINCCCFVIVTFLYKIRLPQSLKIHSSL